jgi:hypothetical protein
MVEKYEEPNHSIVRRTTTDFKAKSINPEASIRFIRESDSTAVDGSDFREANSACFGDQYLGNNS